MKFSETFLTAARINKKKDMKITCNKREIEVRKVNEEEFNKLGESTTVFYKNLNEEWEEDSVEEYDVPYLWLVGGGDIDTEENDIFIEENETLS